eukprot:TRINITY_DN9906_c0_g1_i1.p1 TRINITY_DN9906_c0_g1~~TRINITY_DN9906_c0_g1_i1.p1  ORF type:complete len:375 (-),score=61.60 TRINITY_DN9906_c0_g1_i1:27-1151(-)
MMFRGCLSRVAVSPPQSARRTLHTAATTLSPHPPLSPELTRVGWVGTGVMGRSMAGHLIEAGYTLTVFTRTKSKAEELLNKGATWAATPREVAAKSDVVFSIVGFPSDVEETYLGPDGVLEGMNKGGIVVDMTTSKPSLAQSIYEKGKLQGVASVDAPVSGGDIGARNGALSIMVGGDEEVVHQLQPLFSKMGKVRHAGASGAGQHTKMSNQVMIAATMIGMVEALLYAQRAGLSLENTIETLAAGSAANWSLANYGPRVLQGDYRPGFFIDHFIKDMKICLEEAALMELSLPGLQLVHDLYCRVQARGLGQLGTQALALELAAMNETQLALHGRTESDSSVISAAVGAYGDTKVSSSELVDKFDSIPQPPLKQ